MYFNMPKCDYNFATVIFKKYFIMMPNVGPVTYRWSYVLSSVSIAKSVLPNL